MTSGAEYPADKAGCLVSEGEHLDGVWLVETPWKGVP